MTMDGIDKILEEREKRENDRYAFLKENLDTFRQEIGSKMDEVLEAIRELAKDGKKNQDDIRDIRNENFYLIQRVGILEDQMKRLSIYRHLNTWMKLLGVVAVVSIVVVIILLAFGLEPLVKIVGVLKNFL